MDEKLELKDNQPAWLLQDIKKVFQELYDHYRVVKNRNDYLIKENQKLKDEHYEQDELAKMKKEYDRMKEDYYRGFPISEDELTKIHEWIDKQQEKKPGLGGAIGGRFIYKFVPTSVGVSGTIIDSFTDDKFTFQELG